MARYLQTAQRYQSCADEMYALLPPEHRERGAELIARLVNAGMVGCPRPPQTTVRLNYIKEVCKSLPIRGTMETRKVNPDSATDDRTYNALVVTPLPTKS